MNISSKPISRYFRSISPEYSKIYNDKEMAYLGINRMPLIIGITGPTKAGKTMVAKYLVTEYGYHYECLSAYLRERASALGYLFPNWETLRDIAKQWRKESGNAVLVNVLFKKLESEGILRTAKAIVVDSVMHPEEVRVLQSAPNMHLIAITAEVGLRYRSTVAWERNPPTWEEFIRRDQWERGIRDGDQKPEDEEPNIDECVRLTPKDNKFEFKEGDGARAKLLEEIASFLKNTQTYGLF